jgi:hypothetical protein
MKSIKIQTKGNAKRRLVDAYNSLPITYQFDLFDSQVFGNNLREQCRNLYKEALLLITKGYSPGLIYSIILSLSRDTIIIIHPSYKINSINEFWARLDELKSES